MGTHPKPAGLESQNSIALNTRQYDLPQATDEGLTRALTSRPGNEYPLQNPVPVSTPNGGQSANDPTSYPPNRYANTEPQVSSPGTVEQPSTPKGTTYTVKPSDTLSSIAAAHYGSKSAKSLETLFNANRNVLTDMDHLKSGVVLFIPEMAAPTETKSSAPAAQPADSLVDHRTKQADKPAATKQKSDKKSAEAHTAASSADSKNFRWYQVQKNDRFASIAREQLGDAGRWQEIHEMNKDKFPDPQRIREGVRIKLPLTAVAQAKEKKR
jgi:nucleoid-associated protein YgaU